MKKAVIILSVLVLITGSCKNNPKTADKPETDLFVQTKDTITNIEINQMAIQQKKISVLVLPPVDAMVGMGDSPLVQQYLETALAADSALHLIKFPYKKLMGIPYQQIFDKKYCKPIVDKVETDIIIMSDVGSGLRTEPMNIDIWTIRIRIYNTKTDKQIDSNLKIKNIPYKAVKDYIMKKRSELISEIKTIYKETE